VRVLVVEDERKLAEVVASALRAEHYDVVVASTGEDGFFRANAEVLDLLILDVMLPGRSGLEILRTLRERHIETPVLILTARDGVDDRVRGLDLGADDYLVKPFALPELLARIRALFRRGRPSEALRLKTADLELDLVTRSRDSGGTGLGLAIAKWAVDVNGGQISVDAGADGGSVFRIVLRIDGIPTVNAANMHLAGQGDR
jgi:two-component system copper resistance phosphate regulon response regulator CusR